MSLHYLITLYTESAADQTDHFADVFVCENVAHGYDVMTFETVGTRSEGV